MKTKRLSLFICSILFSVCLISSVSVMGIAKAETNYTLNDIVFSMQDGASVRLDVNGIRFSAEMSMDDYNKLYDGEGNPLYYDSIEYGFFIMPKYYEDAGELNEENCFGDDAIFTTDEAESETKNVILGKLGCMPVERDGVMVVNGSVSNVLDENLNLKFIGAIYMKAVKGEDITYKFAEESSDGARTLIEVALIAIDNGASGEELLALQGYAQKYVEYCETESLPKPQYKYSVEIYKDGELDHIETCNTDIGVIDVYYTEEIEGYVIDTDLGNTTGKVFADGETTLQVYYKKLKSNETITGSPLSIVEKKSATENVIAVGSLTGDFEKAKIGETEISATYDNGNLTLPLDLSGVAVGEGKTLTIETSEVIYTATVDVVDVIINDATELKTVLCGTSNLNDYIILSGDLDCSALTDYSNTHNDGPASFTGTFDGKGYAIKNLVSNGYGFIGYIGSKGVIKNVAFIDANFNNASADTGALTNQFYGTIENVFVSGKTNTRTLVNVQYNGTVNNVIANITTSYSTKDYGVISRSNNGTVSNCYAVSNLTGGIAGGTNAVADGNYAMPSELLSALSGKTLAGSFSMKNGGLYFGDRVVIKPTESITLGNLDKREDNEFTVSLEGTLETVKLNGSKISGCTYNAGTLTIPSSALADFFTEEVSVEVETSEKLYTATANIVDPLCEKFVGVLKCSANTGLTLTFKADGTASYSTVIAKYLVKPTTETTGTMKIVYTKTWSGEETINYEFKKDSVGNISLELVYGAKQSWGMSGIQGSTFSGIVGKDYSELVGKYTPTVSSSYYMVLAADGSMTTNYNSNPIVNATCTLTPTDETTGKANLQFSGVWTVNQTVDYKITVDSVGNKYVDFIWGENQVWGSSATKGLVFRNLLEKDYSAFAGKYLGIDKTGASSSDITLKADGTLTAVNGAVVGEYTLTPTDETTGTIFIDFGAPWANADRTVSYVIDTVGTANQIIFAEDQQFGLFGTYGCVFTRS